MCAALVFAAVTAFASVASAGQEESETFFANGRALRLDGKCDQAIEQFRLAYDAYPEGLGALRNIAECEEELKRPASARRSWWSLRVAVKRSGEEKYKDWDKHAEDRFAQLAGSVAKIVVRVKNGNGVRVLVNGKPLNPTLLGTEIEQDLGETTVQLEDGAVPTERKLVLEAGKTYEVELEVVVKNIPPPETGPGPLVIAGGVTLGVASLALGGFIGAILVRKDALDTIEEECPTYQNCDDSLREVQDRGDTASLLVNVFAIGGGVVLAAGAGMLIAGLVTKSSPTTTEQAPAPPPPKVGVAPLPGGFYLGLDGVF